MPTPSLVTEWTLDHSFVYSLDFLPEFFNAVEHTLRSMTEDRVPSRKPIVTTTGSWVDKRSDSVGDSLFPAEPQQWDIGSGYPQQNPQAALNPLLPVLRSRDLAIFTGGG